MLDLELYNLIKLLLIKESRLRKLENIKSCIWAVYMKQGFVKDNILTWEEFKAAPSPETITRYLRKVKEDHPELDDDKEKREEKEKEYKTKFSTWPRENIIDIIKKEPRISQKEIQKKLDKLRTTVYKN